MADIESNIDININSAQAISAIKQLQAQLSRFYQDLSKSGAKAAADAADLQNRLVGSINATGKFAASIRNVTTTTESFTDSLERNKLSMGQYFRFAGSQVSGFRKVFSTEFDTIDKVARERVKTLQTQYIKLGRDANGAMQAISVRPLKLDMNDLGTQVAMTAQKQQIFNELIRQGSTNLLNFGKNTQWAGRQLMVGFTIPLGIFGAAAAREFMKLEEQTIRFQKVYGDFATTAESTDKMMKSIRGLADEYTKYGVAVEKTIGMAADAAAMGKQGQELLAQVSEATRLAVLGGVEQEQALETTISLTNAFGLATDKLAGKIDFLNAVENQTVTSIEDLTVAIPKAGPVVEQLGGSVEDLAFFMTAMKEGGIDAGEGANALKSGLASMINPTQQSVDLLNSFGVNLKGIVEANKGDVKATVIGFAEALNTLDPLNRAQAIEQLFGKFQFARISTLFQNVTDQASQANRVLQLTNATTEELAVLSEREMKKIEDSPMYQFQGAVERFQTALAPIGESFLKAVTPIIDFGTNILNKFNEMSDGAKEFWTVLVAAVAGLGPVLLMTFGLLANGVANIIKMFSVMGNLFGKLSGQSQMLGGSTQYMTQEQLEAAAIAASLNQVHQNLIQTFSSEAVAAERLAGAYTKAAVAASMLTRPMIPSSGGPAPKKYADGVIMVPGPKGAGDIVPAMLSPGEAVIPADKAKKYSGLIQGMIAGSIPGYSKGKPAGGYSIGDATLSLSGDVAEGTKILDEVRKLGAEIEGIDDMLLNALRESTKSLTPTNIRKILAENPALSLASSSTLTKDGRSTGSQGLIKMHGMEGTPLLPEQLQELMPLLSQAQQDELSKQGVSNVRAQSNLVFGGPAGANTGKMTGKEFGGFVSENPEMFTQFIASMGDNVDPKDPALVAFSQNVARQLVQAGDSAIGDSEFNEIIARALEQEIDAVGANVSASVKQAFAEARKVSTIQYSDQNGRYARTNIGVDARGQSFGDLETISRTTTPYRDIVVSPEQHRAADKYTHKVMADRSGGELSVKSAEDEGADAQKAFDRGRESVNSKDSYLVSRDRSSPHKQAEADGLDDGKAYQDGLERGRAQADNKTSSSGVSVGPPPVVAPTTTPKKLVTGQDAMSAETNRETQLRSQIGMYSGGGNNRLASGMESAVEKVKAKFPKFADKIDAGILSFQKRIDLDGSFAAQEETQQQLLLQAQQRYTEAINQRATRMAAGETDLPEITPESVLDGPQLAVFNADRDAQDKANKKELKRQNRQKLAGKALGAGMIATTALGAMSMTGGPAAEFAQGAMPVAGALTTILPMIVALPGPLKIVAVALGLVAGGMILFNNMLNDGREKGVKFAESMGMGTKAMDEFAEFAGKATSRQVGDKIRERQTSAFAFQSNEKTFGQSYVESEGGQARMKSLEEALKLGTSEEVGRKLGLQLSAAVADNLMTPDQARSIAVNLGEQLDNQEILSNAVAQINKVVGPNGENVLDNGIDLKVNLLQEANNSLLEGQEKADELALARQKKMDAVVGRMNNSLEDPVKWAQSFVDASGQAIGNLFAPMHDAAMTAGMLATNMTQALELTQQLVDATDIYWSRLRDAAIAQGDLAKASELEETRLREKNRLLTEQNDIYKTLEEQVNASSGKRDDGWSMLGLTDSVFSEDRAARDQRWEASRKSIESKFGKEGLDAAVAIKDQANEVATTGITEVRQVQLLAAMDAGTLDPSVAMDIVNIYANDEPMMQKVMSIITEMDPESANRVLALSQAFETEEAKKTFITRFEGASLDEQERYLEAYTFINKVAQAGDEELKVIMDFYNAEENIHLLETVQEDLKVLENTPDQQLSIELVGSIAGVDPAALQGYTAWFQGLPPEQQRAFTSIFTSIYQQIGSKDENVDYQNYLDETGKTDSDQSFREYAGDTAKALTPTVTDVTSAPAEEIETDSTPSGGGGGGGRQGSVLDDILQKLRRLQIATIDLTEGWAGARQALDALFPGGASNSPFQGIEQQMRRLGAKEDLISLIAGMDPEEFQKRKNELFTFDGAGNITGFRDSLLSIGAAFRSINFGTFQNEQQKNIGVLRDQNQAIGKLIANGFSMAEAYEMVQDAAFASAVAQEGNNDIIRQATAEYEAATAAAKLFAAAQAGAQANQSVQDRADTLDFISANSGNLSNEVINEILANQEFANLIMSPTLTQEQKDILQEWIDNIENAAEIELQANLTNIEGMEKIFQDGFNMAMEAFSAQEKKIELEFAVKKDPFQRTVENAQNLIADIQNRPGGMDDLQADIERISFKEEDINKRYKERLDRLQEIKRNNDRILQQRKAELTVADAITQGDIAAAAKAIEDARAQQAQANMQAQQDMLQRQKDAELEALTGQMGLTREQIEMRIRDLRQEILTIEENMLEPAQYQLSLLERQEKLQKEALTVLGMSRREWETLKNRIDVAKTSSDLYRDAMIQARDVVKKIVDYWTEIEKPKTTVHTIITNHVSGGSAGAGNVGASGDGGGGSGNTGTTNNNTPTDPYPSSVYGTLTNQAIRSRYSRFKGGGPSGLQGSAASLFNSWLRTEERSPGGAAAKTAMASLGKFLKTYGFNAGGLVSGYGSGDSIRAMLTPGEFVMTKPAVDAYGARMMKDINNGTFQSGSVYNYSISVNVETDANADQIANTVMRKIKSIDAKRIQGNRF
jgi:TP901 family phage tail tape measure protein